MKWRLYVWGYKRAGDLVVEYGIAEGQQHVLVYPAVFLYRQYIELQIKEIIRNGRLFLGLYKSFPPGFPARHGIRGLWSDCRDVLEKMGEQLSGNERRQYLSELETLGHGINEFCTWDPDPTATRYPVDKKGNPSVFEPRSVNFGRLRELVGDISGKVQSSPVH